MPNSYGIDPPYLSDGEIKALLDPLIESERAKANARLAGSGFTINSDGQMTGGSGVTSITAPYRPDWDHYRHWMEQVPDLRGVVEEAAREARAVALQRAAAQKQRAGASPQNGGASPQDGGGPQGKPAAPDNSPGGLPPKISDPGTSPPDPPIIIAPPPKESDDRIKQLIQEFGMNSIAGPRATTDTLDFMERVYKRYPPGTFRALDVDFESNDPNIPSKFAGVWVPHFKGKKTLFQSGQEEVLGPRGPSGTIEPSPLEEGKIVYLMDKMTFNADAPQTHAETWPMVHEVAHHLTMLIDPAFGLKLVDELGYRASRGPKPDESSAWYFVVPSFSGDVQWDASKVADSSYPSAYARTRQIEHIAELVTYSLVPEARDPNFAEFSAGYLLPDFQMPDAIGATIAARLPPPPQQN